MPELTTIQEEVRQFLKKVPPFQFLEDKALTFVSATVSMEYYPKGTVILSQGGSPSRFLNVIKKGGVKVFFSSDDGGEIGIDYRGEGDSFGFISLIGEDNSRTNVVAIDDTICYQVERETILKMLETNPSFTEYFLKSFLLKSIDKTYQEMHKRSMLYGGGDKMLFTTPVGEIATKKAITESQEVTVQEAARVMTEKNISSLILTDADGMPVGIVTDKDLRSKVVAKGRDINDGVKDIMSRSLVKVDARDYCFEALLKMMRYGIHHLLVIEGGNLKGVVTNHEFMLMQGLSPVSIARDIESRHTIEDLALAAARVNRIIALLLKEGARASNITRILSEINDRLVRQVLEIVGRRHGKAPVPFCWIACGSEGRKEQTFKTDQDNALIYADPRTKEEDEAARAYFARYTADVRDALIRVGFPLCPANYMASNPAWCQPLQTWREYFQKWIYNPTPQAVLSSLVFFDFRPIYGESALAESLRDSLTAMIKDHPVFLGFMANNIIKNRPPIGFFKTFVVEKTGEHKDQLNLKVKGIGPLVDIVRLFALEKGIRETSTLERISSLKDRHTIIEDEAEELEHALEFIMLLRIHNQLEQIESERTPDNFINPNKLSGLEKRTIKDSFQLVSRMQDLIIERYKPMIW
jgi:CBS domain-containing protein